MNTPNLPPDDRDPGAPEPPDDEILAGELVLGVLSAPQRHAAQARRESDAAFAARIHAWEQRLAPWLADIEAVEPPPDMWLQICHRLGWRMLEDAPKGLWHSLTLWRTVAALAMVSTIALWLVRRPLVQPPVQTLRPTAAETQTKPVTTLAADSGQPGWLASVDLARGTVLMVPVPRAPDSRGRVPELWIIPAGKPPRSLGVVSTTRSHTVAVPADSRAALTSGAVLAITLEPPQGVPHNAPTGPIIAKGAIQI